MPPEIPQPGFEDTLAQLEALVAQLESGELPLDEALRAFELGVQLTRSCQNALTTAQQKVTVLLQRDGGVTVKEFAVEDSPEGATADDSPDTDDD